VGLLIARRTLTKFGLAEEYVGEEEPTGEDYNVEAGEGARPFKAYLDVGIKTTSTGAKVFGFLKVRPLERLARRRSWASVGWMRASVGSAD
jgi:hypothetical protein